MTTTSPAIDYTKKATAQDVGAYFFHINVHASSNAPAISENAVLLGKAMINTFDEDSVDELEMLDGFVDCNCGGRGDGKGGRDSSYLGFMDDAKNLVFFSTNKTAILEVMSNTVDIWHDGDINVYLHNLAYSNGITNTSAINPDDSSLLAAYDVMVNGGNKSNNSQAALRKKLTLAVVNDVVYQCLSSYDSIKEAVDFIAEQD